MRGLRYVLFLVLGTGLAAACDRDEESGGLATAPSLASAQGQCSGNFNQLVQAAFTGNNTVRNTVQSYASSMTQAFSSNKAGKATWYGFQILAAIESDGRFLGTAQANSDLAIATLPCMKLGTATLPTSLTTEVGTTGAFAVRGRSATDNAAVLSRNSVWIIEPPEGKSWQDITTLQARSGITADTAKLMLVLGKPGTGTGFNADGDDLIAGSFDWSTLPTATFDNPFVVVGNCSAADGFLQHYPAGNPKAEIFGFVEPLQCPTTTGMLEPAPRNFAERLFRILGPKPAYATALIGKTGGGAKPALSPFGIINPKKVNLGSFSSAPGKKDQIRGQVFNPTPVVNPTSAGGVPFKQPSVLSYLTPVANLGTPGYICYNWAYNDDQGVTDFPLAFYTKAGGLALLAKTVGTVSTGASTGEPVPSIAAGATALAPQFNVKNSSVAITVCPVFDGTTYFTNVLNPNAQKFTFDAQDPTTFPPNYDLQ